MFPQHDTFLPPNAPITLLNGTPVARVVSDLLPTTSTTKTSSQQQQPQQQRARSDTSNFVLPSTTFSIDYCPKRQKPSQLKQQACLPKSYIPFKDTSHFSIDNSTHQFKQLPDSISSFRQQPLQSSQSHSLSTSSAETFIQQPVLRTLSFRANSTDEKQKDPRRSASARLFDPNFVDSSSSFRWFPFGKNYFQHKPFRESEKSKSSQSYQNLTPAVDVQARRRRIEQKILKEQQERQAIQHITVDKRVDPSSEEEEEEEADHHIRLWKAEHYQESSIGHLLSQSADDDDDDDIENPRSPSLNSSPSDNLVIPQTHPSMELPPYHSYPKLENGFSPNKTSDPAASQVDTDDRRKSDHAMHPQHHRIPQLTLPPLPSWHDDIDDPEADGYELNRGMVLGLSSQLNDDKDIKPSNDMVSDQLEKLVEQSTNQISFPTRELSDENDQDALDDDDECASPLSSDASTPTSVSPLNYYIHNGYRYDGDVFELRPPQERSIASRPERILEFKPALLSHRQVFHRVYSEGTYNARPSSLRAQPKRIQSRDSPSTPRSLSTLLSPDSSPSRTNDTSTNTRPLALTEEQITMDIPGQEPIPRPVKRPGSTRPPPVDTSATAIAVAATAAAIESSKLSPDADAIAAVATAAAVAARDARVAAREKAALIQDMEDSQSMPAIIPPRSYRQPGFCETIEAVKQSANAQRNHNLQGLIAFSGVPVTKIEGGKPQHQPSKSSSSSSGERRPRRASDLNTEKIHKSLYADPVYHEGEDENRHPGVLREKRGRSYTSFARNNPYGRKQRDAEKDNNDLRLTEKDAHPRVTIHKHNSPQRERESTSSSGKRSHFWKILSR